MRYPSIFGIIDFRIVLYGQYDHGESENRGAETQGSILRALGTKDPENGQNFKVII